MSLFNAWSFAPATPDSIDADIAKTIALYKDVASKLEVSRGTIHASCTALERWQQRIQHFKDKFMEARLSHADTRSAYEYVEQEHRELVAGRRISHDIAPETASRSTERPQSDVKPLLTLSYPYVDVNQASFKSRRASDDRPTLGQCAEKIMEFQELSLVRGRKRKRSDSDE